MTWLGALALVASLAVGVRLLERALPALVRRAVMVIAVFGPLLAVPYAMWLLWESWISWKEVGLFVGLYLLTGLGVTIGFHRMLTHRSFDTSPAIKAVFLALGSAAFQGGCIQWAAHHMKHHAHSDREGDPHSPRDGFFHAHMGWLIHMPPADQERYCKPILDDPVVQFVNRTFLLWTGVGMLVPYLVAGWRGLLWGGIVRIAFANQVVYAVNSICHTFGSRPFRTRDASRNNWVIAVLAFGEGWHNNHHAFPSMAYHGIGRQFDLSALVLRVLERLSLVWNVKQPSVELVERRKNGEASALMGQ